MSLRMNALRGLVLLACGCCAAQDAPSLLKASQAVRLVDCAPVTQIPCIRVGFTPATPDGTPAPVALPPNDRLLQSILIDSAAGPIAPFYVSTGSGPATHLRPRVVLIEVDISGSMSEEAAPGVTRIDAARAAIARYLDGLRPSVDEVAIVPFESHNVIATIRSAVFTTNRAEALAQLNALPDPGNNTALYQAVFSGVETLQNEMNSLVQHGESAGDFAPTLIVMTDGRNELYKGDDPLLLNGPLGLQQASARVHASGFEVIGIGFGQLDQIDADALGKLSTRSFIATDPAELANALHSSVPLHTAELEVTFLSPWTDRASLAAHDPMFTVTMKLPDGQELQSSSLRYIAPAMGTPMAAAHATPEELEALLASRPPAASGWDMLLRSLLVFVGFATLLIALWFWVPRLVWPGAAVIPVPGANRKWSRDGPVQASAMQVRTQSPEGFEGIDKTGLGQRLPSQITQVQPRTGVPTRV
jgi:hypothetical protein